MYFSDPLTIVLSNPGVSRLSEAQIVRISPVGIGHADEAEAGVPYYDDTFDEDDECTTADISDPDGSIALGLGGMYYEEGMHYTAASERQKRVDCFRAAEILYRHAAGRGNAIGWLCLRYVYAYDRCEGRYFRSYYNNFGEVPTGYGRFGIRVLLSCGRSGDRGGLLQAGRHAGRGQRLCC